MEFLELCCYLEVPACLLLRRLLEELCDGASRKVSLPLRCTLQKPDEPMLDLSLHAAPTTCRPTAVHPAENCGITRNAWEKGCHRVWPVWRMLNADYCYPSLLLDMLRGLCSTHLPVSHGPSLASSQCSSPLSGFWPPRRRPPSHLCQQMILHPFRDGTLTCHGSLEDVTLLVVGGRCTLWLQILVPRWELMAMRPGPAVAGIVGFSASAPQLPVRHALGHVPQAKGLP